MFLFWRDNERIADGRSPIRRLPASKALSNLRINPRELFPVAGTTLQSQSCSHQKRFGPGRLTRIALTVFCCRNENNSQYKRQNTAKQNKILRELLDNHHSCFPYWNCIFPLLSHFHWKREGTGILLQTGRNQKIIPLEIEMDFKKNIDQLLTVV